MSQRRLLLLFCLSVLFLSVVQLTLADGALIVNESRSRLMLHEDRLEVALAVANTTGETRNGSVKLELLDTRNSILAETFETQAIAPGNQTLRFKMPQVIADLTNFERRDLLWYRLKYRLVDTRGANMSVQTGIISLSQIMPDLFEVRVATSEVARAGARYRARVHARHPFTHQPAAGVQVKGTLTFADDEAVAPAAAETTNKDGYAVLSFVIPPALPETPSGELDVVGTRAGVEATASGEIVVDTMVRTLISTDKLLYQPGQTIHVRAVAFGATKHVLANQNMVFRIVDPERVNVYVNTVRTSRFGIVNADWQIPDNVRLGDYRIWVDREGNEEQTYFDVRISRYELPNFTVTAELDRSFYLPGQNAKVKVRADYLFGQPVKHGRVRVVEEAWREWNYREQKMDIEEGKKYEGETNAQGVFEANIKLTDHHEDLAGWNSELFRDVTLAAYFTDPTTNRTEQRRFRVRITKDPIHVYLVWRAPARDQNRDLPVPVYISTYYADGSPAQCKVDLALAGREAVSREEKGSISRPHHTVRTNRYGVAKASLRISDEFRDRPSVLLQAFVTDAGGRSGFAQERFSLDDEARVFVTTEKSLYRVGEPLVASITANLPDQTLVVELAKDSFLLRSTRVRLRAGQATATFPYVASYKGRMTVAAYPDFAEAPRLVGLTNVLYPDNSELNVNIRPSQASYRPGEDATVRFNVRTVDGDAVSSALGVVVSDKAVAERLRTDSDFGGQSAYQNQFLDQLLGLSEQLSGVPLRDLQRWDMTKVVPGDLDLLAEILLNRYQGQLPVFHGGDEYQTELAKVFAYLIEPQVDQISIALHERFMRTREHPIDEKTLREFLGEQQIDLQQMFDPWGLNYRPVFSTDQKLDVFTLVSAGADKRFGTADDFSALRMNWEYFSPIGKKIQEAVDLYHKRTRGFIRDEETLGQELARAGLSLDQMRDRWGRPYRFDFLIKENNFVIEVKSGGPDHRFSRDDGDSVDDFTVWRAEIDYFTEARERIEKILSEKLGTIKKFPQNDAELREALRDSEQPFETLRDAWNRPYYTVYKTDSMYADRVEIENRAALGNPPVTNLRIIPVMRTIATVTLRSLGPDGILVTSDDFTIASFSQVINEETRASVQPKRVAIEMSGANGVIHGIVSDPNGAVIPGVRITVERVPAVREYSGSTNDVGMYVFKDLPPGLYEVRFEMAGFVTAVITSVEVRASSINEVGAVLQPAVVQDAVYVTSGSSEVNMTTTQVISSRSVRELNLETKPGSTSAQISTPRLREYFPETLIWRPAVETDKHGRAEVKFKLADTITTWKLAVIGSTEDGRIGTAETELKAFQPFFVEHDPPRVLTEGDEISLPVVVRNYLERVQKVDLEIKTENWFSLLGPARKQTIVAAGDAVRQTFDFRAIGSVTDGPQRLTAFGSNANDAIEKPITVHPDGEEVSVTSGGILIDSATLEVNLPENVIANSARAELKIYPNLMAHTIESVEGIMKRPYGCGEQTISSTYPSLLLLRNYKQTGEDFPLRVRAQQYLNSGYTRLLSYRDAGGGFSYWSNSNPDVALTAYALKFLVEAADVIAVDRDVIRAARQWLLKQQRTDGSWASQQFAGPSATEGSRHATLTAYVARILATTEAKLVSEATESVTPEERAALAGSLQHAVAYIGQLSNKIDEPYLLASYALTLIHLRDAARAEPVIDKLRSLAQRASESVYWSIDSNTPFYGWGHAGRIETTALVVQALSRYCSLPEGNCNDFSGLIEQGLLFLLSNKDAHGVWHSTQATINVLDTVLEFFAAHKAGRESDTGAKAQIKINGRVVQTVTIPETRRFVTRISVPITAFLSPGRNRIEITRPASGFFSSVQALTNYYVPWAEQPSRVSTGLRLVTKFDKTEARIGDSITCHVEIERVGSQGFGMLLAEVGLPPGAEVDRSSLEAALTTSVSQYEVLPDRIVLYVWPRSRAVNFDFKFRPRFGIAAKTAASVLYDYYNPDSRVVLAPVKFRVK